MKEKIISIIIWINNQLEFWSDKIYRWNITRKYGKEYVYYFSELRKHAMRNRKIELSPKRKDETIIFYLMGDQYNI